ncbi:hypothetical protein FOZ60_000365 [Perkinsus olseni]|uniref:Uncharacterized protein n=1 Tax=Perkinsus olseni TaxID=32597 RepID=A0A7J6P3J8_PEROL|nr:hypothetical protein FOZ60_000365 [Perkinsus olseni]
MKKDSFGGTYLQGEKCTYTWKETNTKRLHLRGPVEDGTASWGGTLTQWTADGAGQRKVAAVYEGQWKDGFIHGRGKMKTANTAYEGEWHMGVIQGEGEMQWEFDGGRREVYKGQWEAGLQHGKGVHIWWLGGESVADRPNMMNRYDGQWREGKRHGSGTFYFAGGSMYTGEWENNKKHGNGSLIDKDGYVDQCCFSEDKCVSRTPLTTARTQTTVDESEAFVNPLGSRLDLGGLLEALWLEAEGTSTFEDIKRDVLDALLRHEGGLKDLYRRCTEGKNRISEDPSVMTSLDLWRLCRNAGLLVNDGIASIDRAIVKKACHNEDTDACTEEKENPSQSLLSEEAEVDRAHAGKIESFSLGLGNPSPPSDKDSEPYDLVLSSALPRGGDPRKGLEALIPIQENGTHQRPEVIDIHAPDRPILQKDFMEAVVSGCGGPPREVSANESNAGLLCCYKGDHDPWDCYIRQQDVLTSLRSQLDGLFTSLMRKEADEDEEDDEDDDDDGDRESIATESEAMAPPTEEEQDVEYYELSADQDMDWMLAKSPAEVRVIALEVLSTALEPASDFEITFAEFQRLVIRMVEELIEQQKDGADTTTERQPTLSSCLKLYIENVLVPALLEGKKYRHTEAREQPVNASPAADSAAADLTSVEVGAATSQEQSNVELAEQAAREDDTDEPQTAGCGWKAGSNVAAETLMTSLPSRGCMSAAFNQQKKKQQNNNEQKAIFQRATFSKRGLSWLADLTKPSLENMDVMNRGRPYEVRVYVHKSLMWLPSLTPRDVQPKILSVDDDPINQMVIASVLETAEFIVHQAMDGFEALDFMSSATTLPDLILLDVMMPGLSGYEVCAKLRAEYPPDLPIIMISAKNSSDDVIKGLKYKCNDYVTKPFEKSELLARINTQVKLRQMVNRQARHRMAVEVLQRILPPASAKRVIGGVYDDLENYREVTIVTCVVEGLGLNDPPKAIASLNKYFNELDNTLKERKALLKMEACDDSYSFICGLSPENAADHTVESLDFARTMIEVAAATNTGLRVRAGVHTIRRMLGGLIRTLCPSDEVEEARHAAVRGVYGCIHLTQEARESYERQKAPLCDNPPPTSVADEGIRATEDIEQADISVEGSIKPPRAVGNRSLDCITIGDPQTTVGDAVRTDHKAPIGSFRWRPVKNTTAVPAGISHSGRKMQADHARDEREENDVAELRARVQQAEQQLLRKENEARIGHTKPTPQHLDVNQLSNGAVSESMSDLQSENEKISAELAEIRSETSAIRTRLFSEHPTLLELEEHEAILEKRTRHLEAISEFSGILLAFEIDDQQFRAQRDASLEEGRHKAERDALSAAHRRLSEIVLANLRQHLSKVTRDGRIEMGPIVSMEDIYIALVSARGNQVEDAAFSDMSISLKTPPLSELRERYISLNGKDNIDAADIDATDRLSYAWEADQTRTLQRESEAGALIASGADPAKIHRYLRGGAPSQSRLELWALALDSAVQPGELDDLLHGVIAQKWITDDIIRDDVAERTADGNYFPFEDLIESLSLTLSRDPWVGTNARAAPHQPIAPG